MAEKVSFLPFFEGCYKVFNLCTFLKRVTQNETIFWMIFKHCVSFHCVPDKKHLNVDIYLTEMEEG